VQILHLEHSVSTLTMKTFSEDSWSAGRSSNPEHHIRNGRSITTTL